jgi:hypothetical protein
MMTTTPKLKAIPYLLDLVGISNCIVVGLHQLSSSRQLIKAGRARLTHARLPKGHLQLWQLLNLH